MKQYDVLIVEDDLALCEALCDTLESEGYHVMSASNGTQALLQLSKNKFKLVVSDVQMPVMDGFELLQNIQRQYAGLPVLLMTAYGTVPKAVNAMQCGAVDYLIKPFEAASLVAKVAEFVVANAAASNDRVIKDNSMKNLYALAAKVAKTNVAVLLYGESGTGKEVMAQYIHQNSPCHDGPFVAVNCAAIPENMLEAMLFGYEKGAFTGAHQAMPGKFEQAQLGTLLLDEISEMDLSLQAKLLRVLQEKEVERLGSNRKISLHVRILATTNQQLKEQVEKGMFREDLYYRLNVFPIKIPALRDRPGDILPLAGLLMQRHWQHSRPLPVLDKKAIHKMLEYPWPGNVRELENIIQRALILHTASTITAADLVFEEDMQVQFARQEQSLEMETTIEQAPEDQDAVLDSLDDGLRSAEEKIIIQTLQQENGSRKVTAEKLRISPRTLRYKLAKIKASGVSIPC
jgi:two-component system, response regulator FlrC